MSACITSVASLPSSSSCLEDSSGRVKLRLCFNGRFEQTPNQQAWKFVGAEYFNESIGYGVKYADFMFKLSEKFKTAVSVKYAAPGEDLDPETLISVQDDADLQELVEDYFAHLERPGTPSKTFRIKVFVFMAAEEPLTPDEIMEGQTFFSEMRVAPPRLRTYRGLDGRSSWGSTLSSTGTPCTRQQDMSTGDWPSSIAGQAPALAPEDLSELQLQHLMASAAMHSGGSEQAAHSSHSQQQRLPPIDSAMEQEALDRVRMSVSYSHQHQLPRDQYRAAAGGRGYDSDAGVSQLLEDEHEDGEDDDGDADSLQDAEQIAEVLAAIEQQQQQRAAQLLHAARVDAAGADDAAAEAAAEAEPGAGDDGSSWQQPSEEASLPADPWDMSDEAAQQPVDASQLPSLPSHISTFGDDGNEQQEQNGDSGEPDAAAGRPSLEQRRQRSVRFDEEGAGAAVLDAITAASQLPSHISAFGDDLGSNEQEGFAALAGSDELEAEAPANRPGQLSARLAGGYGRPRTQDSSFSLDGELGAAGEGQAGGEAGGCQPDRQDSGDSLASLPKLQPVHRLAKPDLRIVAKIGEGAFGEVSVASAPLYGTVAVKWLKSERFGKHFASFGREAALLADLNHPNVLRFFGVVTESAQDNTVIGIMTEYIRGGSMSSFLRMSRSLLPLRTRCELALAASNGLAYLHELRIVHFDLKPDNLLLDAPPAVVRAAAGADLEEPVVGIRISSAAAGAAGAGAVPLPASSAAARDAADGSSHGGSSVAPSVSGRSPAGSSRGGRGGRRSSGLIAAPGSFAEFCEVPVVKVADFGLSKHKLNSTYVSSCRDLRGTLPYMAPELVADPERVCEKADVWSLGVVMWEMLTREIPFQDLAPQQILMGLMCGNLHLDIPEWCEPEWRGLLEACLEPNPSARPSMRELARQLEAIRDQQLAHEQQRLQAQDVAPLLRL
ncbi:hypothetical protein OEZ86_009625 [Tetradesmus obliquus]|uniref:Protein kinase domain-containing protein n=1 Tax=Tetradesmus obliquus TaxID=3088 RepID=A0ABY8UNF7_TETOB|nr:hypothetical protein OEZ85_001068 [Tetradesmus obliquus]WIA43106.1 hypothetical protein OEZ86_009625 [Tetradesmus obliquus]